MESSVAAIHARSRADRVAQLLPSLTDELVRSWAADPAIAHTEPMFSILRCLEGRPENARVGVYEERRARRWRLVHPPQRPVRHGQGFRLADRREFDSATAAREACLRRELYDVFGWGPEPADAVDGPVVSVDEPMLLGYADRLSASPGDPITFMVSAEGPSAYDTVLVRLRHADDDPAGPGVRVAQVGDEWTGTHEGVT